MTKLLYKRQATSSYKSDMQEATPTPLQIPEIALIIISHLDPPTILSLRYVSFSINTLILRHQKSISKAVIEHHLPEIDWHPPELDYLSSNYHLKTLTRLPKAYHIAHRANKNCECMKETSLIERKGLKRRKVFIFKRTASYPAFLARCARSILILWTLNDIRRHIDQSEPFPRYIPPPPAPSKWKKVRGLFSRITNITSRVDAVSPPPVDPNVDALSVYVNSLASRSESQVQKNLSEFDPLGRTYLDSIPRSHGIDLLWVQTYLVLGMPMGTHQRRAGFEEKCFVLQQGPSFLLSCCSKDPSERLWALSLTLKVCQKRLHDFWLEEWDLDGIWYFMKGDSYEEAERAKDELTRGDWRHGNGG